MSLRHLAIIVVALTISTSAVASSEHAEACPNASAQTLRIFDSFLKKDEMYPEANIPEDIVRTIRGGVDALASPRNQGVCQRLNRIHAERYLDQAWGGSEAEAQSDYVRYEAGYYQAGDFYFAVFTPTLPPQPQNLDEIVAHSESDKIFIYDERLKKVASYSL